MGMGVYWGRIHTYNGFVWVLGVAHVAYRGGGLADYALRGACNVTGGEVCYLGGDGIGESGLLGAVSVVDSTFEGAVGYRL